MRIFILFLTLMFAFSQGSIAIERGIQNSTEQVLLDQSFEVQDLPENKSFHLYTGENPEPVFLPNVILSPRNNPVRYGYSKCLYRSQGFGRLLIPPNRYLRT